MEIEVAYAAPEQQIIITIEVPEKTIVRTAIERSGILKTEILKNYLANNTIVAADSIEYWKDRVAIFGERVSLDTVLKAGDRIELLRPLLRSPKDARREKVRILNKIQAREKQKKHENLKANKKKKHDY